MRLCANLGPVKPPSRFPHKVRSGSVSVTVYRILRGNGREVFAVGWKDGATHRRQQSADLAEALREAKLKAEQLAAGRVESAHLTISERDEYQAAKERAGGVPLVQIVETWAKARDLAGADILAACQQWADRHGGRAAKSETVEDAHRLFIAQKKADGVKVKAGYDRTLPGFVQAFGAQPIAAVGPEAISGYLSKFANAGSRNSHRKRIVAFFRWARKRGLLPLDVMTAAERTDTAREHRVEIGLVTPDQLREAFATINAKAPADKRAEYLAALALAAFCGLRRAEVHGQRWEDIDLERGLLRVSAAKPNTPARRLVPIGPAGVAWLTDKRPADGKGPVCSNLAIDRLRDICRTAGLDLADNGFRHSWISARVMVTGNVNETSLEAGNTPSILHRHYRELMRKDEAEAWFAVAP